MTSIVGYSRQLAAAPSIELDTAELTSAGAQSIFTDGRVADVRQRPGLAECLRSLEPGDLLITSSAVRLSHSLPHFVTTIADLSARGILFHRSPRQHCPRRCRRMLPPRPSCEHSMICGAS